MAVNFRIVKRGYDPDEVNIQIARLEKTINEYRDKDALISNAIKSAQSAADRMVEDAKNEAAKIRQTTLKQVEAIAAEISKRKYMLEAFYNDYNALVERYLTPIRTEDFTAADSNQLDALSDYLNTLIDDCKDSIHAVEHP